ncbi:MAG: hypothetical protein IKR85_02805 [Clostridia bacterium]|nr:hypothetical protein [Clostridia bacterium]
MKISEMYPKAWERLKALDALRESVRALDYEVKSLKSAAARTARRYGGVNLRAGEEPEGILAAAASARAEAEEARKKLSALIAATDALLRRLERPLYKALLTSLYLDGLSPCEVRRAFGYSQSGYYRALCSALKELEALLTDKRAGNVSA